MQPLVAWEHIYYFWRQWGYECFQLSVVNFPAVSQIESIAWKVFKDAEMLLCLHPFCFRTTAFWEERAKRNRSTIICMSCMSIPLRVARKKIGKYQLYNSYKLWFCFSLNFSYICIQTIVKIRSAFEYCQCKSDWQKLDYTKLKKSYMKYWIDFDHDIKQIFYYEMY